MRLLEYESKEILNRYGIRIPKGELASSPKRPSLNPPLMLKAQIPLGGRGRAGGVIEVSDEEEAEAQIAELLRRSIRGYKATRILVEEKIEAAQELFMGITYDTVAKSPVAIFSPEGGIEIEELTREDPQKVKTRRFSVRAGLLPHQARGLLREAGISGRPFLALGSLFCTLGRIFLDHDATLLELNPLVLTQDGALVALDCHMEIDDDALFRQRDLAKKQKDTSRFEGGRLPTSFERKAAEIDALDHRGVAGRLIEFDGNLGLIIGGGGASLTAFDAIRESGGHPANYCEIGGNPSVRKVKELTKHILSKPNVEKIAVIMNVVSNTRVDLVARGVIKGILELGKDPSETVAVFRIPGAWEEEGLKILSKYGVPYYGRNVSIDEAARIAVEKTKS